MRRTLTLVSMLLVTAIVAPPTATDADDTVKISRRNREILQTEYIPSIRAANLPAIVESAARIFSRSDLEELARVEKFLAIENVPPLARSLSEARFRLAGFGMVDQKKPSLNELLVTIPIHQRQILAILEDVKRHDVSADPLLSANDWNQYESWLWDIHVFQNKLQNAVAANQFMAGMQKRIHIDKKTLQAIDEDQRTSLNIDLAKMGSRLKEQLQEINEREIELRIYRLEDAVTALGSKQTSIVDRLKAAYVVKYDGVAIGKGLTALSQNESKPRRSNLNDPSLLAAVGELVKTGTDRGGDMIHKSSLLHVGMHWWLRGRFGRGPLNNGLLKSPAAVRNEAEMFRLVMPEKIPVPTDPVSESGSRDKSYFVRRHHHNWQIETYNWKVKTERITSGPQERDSSILHQGFV